MGKVRFVGLRPRFGAFLAVSALVVSSCLSPAMGAARADPTARPNIVLILVDDLDAVTTPYWDAMPKAKALLADRGMTFTEAFAPTPICCPARATILTGNYGHNTGVLNNGPISGGWEQFVAHENESHSVAVRLHDTGYSTMLAGKYLNGYEGAAAGYVPAGWTEWYGVASEGPFYSGNNYWMNENGSMVWHGLAAEDYGTDLVAGRTVDFIRRMDAEDDDKPFFAYVAPPAPHMPSPPAPRHRDHPWKGAALPVRPNAPEIDLSDKPQWLQQSAPVHNRQRSWAEHDHQQRMGSLLAVDDMVAGIFDTLDETGELENTYVVFASDNGYNMWAHQLIHKSAPYEESLRIPMVVTGPDVAIGQDDSLVTLADLAPTFVDLASAPAGTPMDGRSLAARLRGGAGAGPASRSAFPIRYISRGAQHGLWNTLWPPLYYWWMVLVLAQDVPSYSGVRTTTHLYVRWYDEQERFGFHEEELYDLEHDPWQLDNLLATPEGREENAALLDQLRGLNTELQSCAGATCP